MYLKRYLENHIVQIIKKVRLSLTIIKEKHTKFNLLSKMNTTNNLFLVNFI